MRACCVGQIRGFFDPTYQPSPQLVATQAARTAQLVKIEVQVLAHTIANIFNVLLRLQPDVTLDLGFEEARRGCFFHRPSASKLATGKSQPRAKSPPRSSSSSSSAPSSRPSSPEREREREREAKARRELAELFGDDIDVEDELAAQRKAEQEHEQRAQQQQQQREGADSPMLQRQTSPLAEVNWLSVRGNCHAIARRYVTELGFSQKVSLLQ